MLDDLDRFQFSAELVPSGAGRAICLAAVQDPA